MNMKCIMSFFQSNNIKTLREKKEEKCLIDSIQNAISNL